MGERIANVIVLGEDTEHQNLIRKYLQRVGHDERAIRFEALPASRGSGSQFVRTQFPRQVAACRGILGRKTRCLLIVITDADNLSVQDRERTLENELRKFGHDPITANEPIVILIPKWQVETWIKCLLGQTMDEDDRESDHPPVTASEIKASAETLFNWTRNNAQVGLTCVPSLRAALPRWRKIDLT
jgi:hypothetical protein